jgi:hypothetical protein
LLLLYFSIMIVNFPKWQCEKPLHGRGWRKLCKVFGLVVWPKDDVYDPLYCTVGNHQSKCIWNVLNWNKVSLNLERLWTVSFLTQFIYDCYRLKLCVSLAGLTEVNWLIKTLFQPWHEFLCVYEPSCTSTNKFDSIKINFQI